MKKFIILLLMYFAMTASKMVSANDIKVVARPTTDINYVTLTDVRYMFSLRKTFWDDGTPVVVTLLPFDNFIHIDFVKKILKVSPARLRRVMEARINAGKAYGVLKVRTMDEMLYEISRRPGAIGYIDKHLIMEIDDEIRIINIL